MDSYLHGNALRRGRFSQPGATYFLTFCTEARQSGLTAPAIAGRILEEAHAMAADTTWSLIAATVMPDHVHLLITLGERLAIEKAVNRHKAKTSSALKSHTPDLTWERGFFDHKLRADESRACVLHYLYLNPYRAELCNRSANWPCFFCRADEWAWLKDSLTADLPPPEWIEM